MAVKGTYTFRGLDIPDVYLKVMTISGNEAGWNAQIGAFATATSTDPLEVFNKSLSYRPGIDPFGDFEDKLLVDFPGFVRVSPKRITRLEFLQRFTMPERIAIRTAAKQSVALEDYLELVSVATFIDVTRPDTINGVRYLESVNLIGVGRADQILDPDTTD
jgi:hypothetical protein